MAKFVVRVSALLIFWSVSAHAQWLQLPPLKSKTCATLLARARELGDHDASSTFAVNALAAFWKSELGGPNETPSILSGHARLRGGSISGTFNRSQLRTQVGGVLAAAEDARKTLGGENVFESHTIVGKEKIKQFLDLVKVQSYGDGPRQEKIREILRITGLMATSPLGWIIAASEGSGFAESSIVGVSGYVATVLVLNVLQADLSLGSALNTFQKALERNDTVYASRAFSLRQEVLEALKNGHIDPNHGELDTALRYQTIDDLFAIHTEPEGAHLSWLGIDLFLEHIDGEPNLHIYIRQQRKKPRYPKKKKPKQEAVTQREQAFGGFQPEGAR